ncbi:DNA topoisomerase 2-binding protein 1-like [Petaurus breviceps papuanus]|uniref:DNA topoisomerase 2-binding protein 1-like n=1 Tax=Petaurus breviceps papuanus TaxID=3040969 RepID=UPI0036D98062
MSRRDKDPHVKFLKAQGNSELFFAAFGTMKEYLSEEYLQTLTEEQALNMKENDKSLFICEPFSGIAFDHLQKLGCRIVGPQVIIFCIQHRRCIPKSEYPVYNMIMADIIISCTSLDKEAKKEIHKYVQMMGGRFCRDLNMSVTHLIAGEVGSKKYLVAASLGKPIMLPSWIKELWKKSWENSMTQCKDINMEIFKCPLFFGCTICVSGLCTLERRAIQQLTAEHGGHYMGHLHMNECTHLIVQEPKGQKYECAKRWNIHCVTVEWFYHSIEKGFCQDEAMYRTEPVLETKSEPCVSGALGQNSDASYTLSGVCHISNIHSGYINESTHDSVMNNLGSLLKNLQNLNISAFQTPVDLLDGCRIYLCGFRDRKLDQDKLRRLINYGGGICFNQLNEDVTHVIVGDYDDELKQFWTKSTHRPHVAGAKWLLESFRKGYLLSEEQYIQLDYQPVQMSLAEQQGMKRNNSFSKIEFADAEKPQQVDEELLSQNDNDDMIVDDDEMTGAGVYNDPSHIIVQMENQSSFGHNLLPESNTVIEGLFSQKSFLVVGFREKDEFFIANAIQENAGKILPLQSRTIADYIVVPLLGCKVESAIGKIVTNTWLITCIEQQNLFDPESNPLFTPVPVLEGSGTPLENCVLSFSQFIGAEKDSLAYLASLLGARVQEFFVCQDSTKNDVLSSTHLIVKQPDDSKYQAAQKWGLPAVSMAWILETAKLGKRANECKFLVGNLPKQGANRAQPAGQGPDPRAARRALQASVAEQEALALARNSVLGLLARSSSSPSPSHPGARSGFPQAASVPSLARDCSLRRLTTSEPRGGESGGVGSDRCVAAPASAASGAGPEALGTQAGGGAVGSCRWSGGPPVPPPGGAPCSAGRGCRSWA